MSVTDIGIGTLAGWEIGLQNVMKYKCFPLSERNARECDQGPGVPMSAPKFSVKCPGQGTLCTQLRYSLRNNHARAGPEIFS